MIFIYCANVFIASARSRPACLDPCLFIRRIGISKNHRKIFMKFEEWIEYGPKKSRLNCGSDSEGLFYGNLYLHV